MENSPLNESIDTDSSAKKESKSKKKKAGAIGAFAVELKPDKEKSFSNVFESSVESESAAPLDHLAQPEKQFAEREFTKAEQAADLESVPVLERFRDRIIIEDQDSETALAETLAELEDLPDAEIDHGKALSHEAETEAPIEIDESPQEFGEEAILLNEQAETTTDDEPSMPIVKTATPTIGSSRSSGGGGGHPTFNTAPLPPTHTVEYRRGNTADSALVGGVVGYLIGRRKGRIKTEKRLIPIQKKLQKEVTSLQSQLQQKEARIRAVAATKAQVPAAVNYTERVIAKVPESSASVRTLAPEANQLHGKRHAPEQIGHVLVGAESFNKLPPILETSPKIATPEKPIKTERLDKNQPPILSVEKNIDTLNRVDLLKLSEKIVIDGSSLRQIYETRLVGEKGLRRLVKEHLKGGDVKKALRREIIEREIDFERDPGLRDQRPQPATPTGAGRAATLNDLLQNAELTVGEDQEEVAFLKARSAYEEQQNKQQKNHQKLMDISFVSIILILLGLVVILVMSHY